MYHKYTTNMNVAHLKTFLKGLQNIYCLNTIWFSSVFVIYYLQYSSLLLPSRYFLTQSRFFVRGRGVSSNCRVTFSDDNGLYPLRVSQCDNDESLPPKDETASHSKLNASQKVCRMNNEIWENRRIAMIMMIMMKPF